RKLHEFKYAFLSISRSKSLLEIPAAASELERTRQSAAPSLEASQNDFHNLSGRRARTKSLQVAIPCETHTKIGHQKLTTLSREPFDLSTLQSKLCDIARDFLCARWHRQRQADQVG
ncbi:hypothetical protein N7489_003541, partial [Penicillium chrysogenum]|uniref:uncharacterized protein n=1 Tax=Penicillium chrysogenum TaxID=5076 RepID=UPI0024DF1C98